MRLMVVAIFVSTVTISACASSPQQIQQAFNPLIGTSINALIQRWGPPSAVTPLANGGGAVYTWLYGGGAASAVTTYYPYTNIATTTSAVDNPSCQIDWTANSMGVITYYRTVGSCKVTTGR